MNRIPLVLVWAGLFVPVFAGVSPAQETWPPRGKAVPEMGLGRPGGGTAVTLIDKDARLRIDRALEYLHRNQSPEGYWTDRVGRKVHYTYRGQVAPHVGVTALAGMAFLSSGALPDSGARERYSIAVRKALEFILRSAQPNGFITAHGSRMYEHAFATLFLAEAIGTGIHPEPDRVRACLKGAVNLIVSSQNAMGGWRYLPGAEDADMSITVCQVMALRGSRNVGIQVPKETIDRAVRYVKQSFNREEPGKGAFRYQIDVAYPMSLSRWTFALTACGVVTLCGAGEYNTPEVRQGLQFLWRWRPPREIAPERFDYYYAHYYAVQAAFQAGGSYWTTWYRDIQRDLLALQEPDGSWNDLVGANYATAMAAIILQMPNQYLPIMEN